MKMVCEAFNYTFDAAMRESVLQVLYLADFEVQRRRVEYEEGRKAFKAGVGFK